MKLLIPALLILPLAACSWGIKLDSAGKDVRVAWNDDVSGCRDMGKITVSVLDKVGPVNRSAIKINDELEVMARNEAAGMQADTISPLGEARDGEQSWAAYACGAARRAQPSSDPARKPTDVGDLSDQGKLSSARSDRLPCLPARACLRLVAAAPERRTARQRRRKLPGAAYPSKLARQCCTLGTGDAATRRDDERLLSVCRYC